MRTGNYMRLRKWNSGRISCWTLKPAGESDSLSWYVNREETVKVEAYGCVEECEDRDSRWGQTAAGKMDISPAGRYLCCNELSTSARPTLTWSSAAWSPFKAAWWDATSCSRLSAAPPSGSRDRFEFIPIPVPGMLKQLVSSLASRLACVCTVEMSCCNAASRWFEFPMEFPAAAEFCSFSRRRSRDSRRRFSSCRTILLPAVSTAAPQEPPYWAMNLDKGATLVILNISLQHQQPKREFWRFTIVTAGHLTTWRSSYIPWVSFRCALQKTGHLSIHTGSIKHIRTCWTDSAGVRGL